MHAEAVLYKGCGVVLVMVASSISFRTPRKTLTIDYVGLLVSHV